MTIASFILILIQFADLLTTIIGISLGAIEINPLKFTWTTVTLKFIVTFFIVWILNVRANKLRWLVWIPSGVMLIVVIWNIINIVLMVI